jgi:hypothetical protein
MAAAAPLRAQWATQVIAHQFGANQTAGQSSDYFPANVLGSVSAAATVNVPANLPSEVLSLGRNGWVVLGFDGLVLDEAGADFTVFENAFTTPTGYTFDEWLIVSVSMDGQTWQTFPYDTLTGAGMAGRTPTYENAYLNYRNPALSGGDAFDLAQLGLSQARYVRLQDATQYQSFDRLSAEVDAVAVLHRATANDAAGLTPSAWGVACVGGLLRVFPPDFPASFRVVNMQGQEITRFSTENNTPREIPLFGAAAGYYYVQSLSSGEGKALWWE